MLGVALNAGPEPARGISPVRWSLFVAVLAATKGGEPLETHAKHEGSLIINNALYQHIHVLSSKSVS